MAKVDNLQPDVFKELKNVIAKKTPDPELQAFERDLLRSVKEMKAGKAAQKTRVKVLPVVSARHASGLS